MESLNAKIFDVEASEFEEVVIEGPRIERL